MMFFLFRLVGVTFLDDVFFPRHRFLMMFFSNTRDEITRDGESEKGGFAPQPKGPENKNKLRSPCHLVKCLGCNYKWLNLPVG